MSDLINPFIVPPFDAGENSSPIQYVWWSWHPLYPYWSKSCWTFNTVEEALTFHKINGSLDYYHNKLIKEEDGKLTEVYDAPCERLDIWIKIKENMDKGFYKKT
jgi:hypothetical protein